MPRRLATAKIAQAMSTQSSPRAGHGQRSISLNSIPLTPYGLDRVAAYLGTQPADVDVDHVGAGIEMGAPDGGQDSLLANGFAGARNQLPQKQKFTLGKLNSAECTA